MQGQTNYLLPEDPSISVNAHDSLVPEQVNPNSTHGAHGVEEGPGVLHLAQLSAAGRVGVPVRDTVIVYV